MNQEAKPFTILVADDELDILEILNFNLQSEGYQCNQSNQWK